MIKEIAEGYYNLARQKLGILPETILDMGSWRYAICHACPEYEKDGREDRCGLCGCMMKAKVLSPSSWCPVGSWKQEPITVAIKDNMKTITPGHRYILQNSVVNSTGQVVQFLETEKISESELKVHSDGTSESEMINVLIDRITYLEKQKPTQENRLAILHLKLALKFINQSHSHEGTV